MLDLKAEDLLHRDGWVCFRYSDGSVHVFRTTLNEDMLKRVGGAKQGYLYDLDKFKWVEVPTDTSVQLIVSETKPEMSEVDKFANQFI